MKLEFIIPSARRFFLVRSGDFLVRFIDSNSTLETFGLFFISNLCDVLVPGACDDFASFSVVNYRNSGIFTSILSIILGVCKFLICHIKQDSYLSC